MRIPLGGGGTDLPSYYSQFGGFLISAAINRYTYITVKPRFEESIRVSYSRTEIVDRFHGGALREMVDTCITVPFNSTPQVESFHAALGHLICLCLREKIQVWDGGGQL